MLYTPSACHAATVSLDQTVHQKTLLFPHRLQGSCAQADCIIAIVLCFAHNLKGLLVAKRERPAAEAQKPDMTFYPLHFFPKLSAAPVLMFTIHYLLMKCVKQRSEEGVSSEKRKFTINRVQNQV